jgi:hypothetical protein
MGSPIRGIPPPSYQPGPYESDRPEDQPGYRPPGGRAPAPAPVPVPKEDEDEKPPSKWQLVIATSWKAVTAIAGGALIILNTLLGQDFWPENVAHIITVSIAFITPIAVWLTSNTATAEDVTGVDLDKDGVIGRRR